MIFESKAPTRIDLAGGTLDIWPLYLLLKNPMTVNVAINIFASCTIETHHGRAVRIDSQDQGESVEASSALSLKEGGTLDLLVKMVKHFDPSKGFRMRTSSMAPKGSGLGGSSALAVSACGALAKMTGRNFPPMKLLHTAKDVETRVLRVPTGEQDYYPAIYGGINALHFRTGGTEMEKIETNHKALQNRLVLCFSGVPRFSGLNNWSVFKKALDGDRKLAVSLGKIALCANKMREALVEGDMDSAGRALAEEWRERSQLSSSISTPEIEKLMKEAKRAGAIGGKVCGAGGGGCIVFVVKEGMKQKVENALKNIPALILDFEIVTRGLVIRSRNTPCG